MGSTTFNLLTMMPNAVVTPLRKAASYEPRIRYSHFRDLG